MATSRNPKFLWLFVGVILATVLLAGPLGYIVGTSNVGVGQLTDKQNSFVSGVAQGVEYKVDFSEWDEQDATDKNSSDVRAFPEIRCASKFYPKDPIGMSGCLQGINEPADKKYFIPDTGG